MMKRNIISGLLLFCLTITLGPYMMRSLNQEEGMVTAQTELREAFGELRTALAALNPDPAEGEDEAGSEVPAQPAGIDQVSALAQASARAARAHVNWDFAQFRRGNITFTHAHGNLQGMLNILLGLFLGNLAVHALVRHAISWGFIVGSWIMVGSLFLGNMMGMTWALKGIMYGGTVLIVSLFALSLVVILRGFKKETEA